jgi:hypothetical protein
MFLLSEQTLRSTFPTQTRTNDLLFSLESFSMSAENSQINDILASLKEMLEELNENELNMVEDFIVNECSIDNTDEDDEYPNLFRMFITDTFEEY